MELWRQSAVEVAGLLARGEVSPSELLDVLEPRIAAVDPAINALPTLCFDHAREAALRMEKHPPGQRGPLCGLPVTIKDLTDVAGVRTTYGSALYRDHVPGVSDALVRRIEQRGGIVHAKSNTPEFGTGGITFNDVFGITRSPRNTACASGGSSGGAAASLASGCAWLSHGSDMAGSLRTPSAFCGVTSLRPSPGRISADAPLLPFDPLGQDGPMARSIADLALFSGVLFDEPPAELAAGSLEPKPPRRVAISPDLGITRVDDALCAMVSNLADRLSAAGVDVVEAVPDLSGVHQAFDTLRAHAYAVSLEDTLAASPGVVKDEVAWNVEQGIGLDSATLRRAQRLQGGIVSRAAGFMDDFDLLICAATSVTSVVADTRYPGFRSGTPIAEYYRWLAIAYATTMTALPIVTLPVSPGADGIPLAVQLVGRPAAETTLLQHGLWMERLVEWNPEPVDPWGST
jgi:amidase